MQTAELGPAGLPKTGAEYLWDIDKRDTPTQSYKQKAQATNEEWDLSRRRHVRRSAPAVAGALVYVPDTANAVSSLLSVTGSGKARFLSYAACTTANTRSITHYGPVQFDSTHPFTHLDAVYELGIGMHQKQACSRAAR